MKRRILYFFILLIVLTGAFFLLRGLAYSDRVDRNFSDGSQLDEAALTWFPFGRSALLDSKEISLRTDLDTNHYFIQFKFLTAEGFQAFRGEASKIGKSENIDCAAQRRPECEEMKLSHGSVDRIEIPLNNPASGKSTWILNPVSLQVLGATQIPVPRYFK
jgi:hypothetical protein